jgi:hypothetical protein
MRVSTRLQAALGDRADAENLAQEACPRACLRWRDLQITEQSSGRVRTGKTLDQAQIAAGLTFDGEGDGAVYPRTLPVGYPHLYVGEGPKSTVACVGAEIGYADKTPQTVVTRPETGWRGAHDLTPSNYSG